MGATTISHTFILSHLQLLLLDLTVANDRSFDTFMHGELSKGSGVKQHPDLVMCVH